MTPEFSETWSSFVSEFEARNRWLMDDLTSSWSDLRTSVPAQSEGFGGADETEVPASLQELFDSAAQRVLLDPVASLQKLRPLQRALAAFETYDSRMEDWGRKLPATLVISPRDFAEALRPHSGSKWAMPWVFGRKPRAVPVRSLARTYLQKWLVERSKLDGALLLRFAQRTLAILTPWQAISYEALRREADLSPQPKSLAEARRRWSARVEAIDKSGAELLQNLERKLKAAPARLSQAVRKGGSRRLFRDTAVRSDRRARYFEFWSRQQRAVLRQIVLEEDAAKLGRLAVKQTEETLESAETEHSELLQELESVRDWLERWAPRVPDVFPAPHAQLIAADNRVDEWSRAMEARAQTLLPNTLEAVEPRAALPGRRAPWRQIEPRRMFLEAMKRVGVKEALEGFREVETSHRAVVQEIEHAREVVAFGLETAQEEGGAISSLVQESVTNALSLIEHQKKELVPIAPGIRKALVRATAITFAEFDLVLEQSKVGLWTHLVRQSGLHVARQLWRLIPHWTQAATRSLRTGSRDLYRAGLRRVGWLPPEFHHPEPVFRTASFGQLIHEEAAAKDLPALYRRLFRLQPVEDPRFLIGREAELAALEEARRLWEAGQSVSVLVVGARGSGKTSLLNCAAASLFQADSLFRGQFGERLTREEHLEQFLHKFLVVPDGEDLAEALAKQRRVVMIEEMERTFLRHMNGFDALRALLRLVSRSWQSTLWIFAVNQTAYDFLDATVGLGKYFSHRINATSVDLEHLRSAILMRHNLSGLRLQFAAPPGEYSSGVRLRKYIASEQDARDQFFDALYRESDGIFRAAFELWQRQIERVEGGVLYLRHPIRPDYEPLTSQLTIRDCFLLQCVLQHGMLSVDDAALVLGITAEQSHSLTDRLLALGILEPEPGAPAFRIRPEAGQMVRDLLHRQNLL